ncbi:MAG: hypothetical protein FWF37_00150 [Chloroflexi bacterium]|nr:hypothetical protein [Chloroflexota bacterium]
MLDKLGKKKYALPAVAVIVLCCGFSFMMYPMLSSPMGAIMGGTTGAILIMPAVMMTMICSILLSILFKPAKNADQKTRLMAYGIQLGYIVVLSLLVSIAAPLVAVIGGLSIPFGEIMLFLWVASFSIMALFVGAFNIARPVGIVVVATTMLCGMFTGMILPVETLPGFWQHFIAPWAPQRYMGEGLISIISGKGAWGNQAIAFTITAIVGVLLTILAFFIPSMKKLKK